uniref:Thioredoxin domain-containing protein n=1 Tax=Erythrolobus madagascarensis TaxID=708628 RepID=A0A7S0T8B0_9RHOD|eukprot:CAMPEP_0185851116 /NCGR_PEP_ID=MMETSP1354-20130828/5821_1 /TAXON_ID=708628 /ORGANISM="Erythrolobus madagascarensis, Strain CCMP3276" /LENGTH=545 /DNA_ID=CAMNT_0028551949 /DNA_START=53 /DNA_END=1690 /DNA_ORIENTATION=-
MKNSDDKGDSDNESKSGDAVENVVIIGSGPAGYTAAIYAARANMKPLLFEGVSAGIPGGQLMTTSEVENFPGFAAGITGPELMAQMRAQAKRWGAQIVTDDVTHVDLSEGPPFTLRAAEQDDEIQSYSVIVATGASAKRLGIETEESFWSRGVSACAICDGTAPIFRDRVLAVVGGGDSGCEEAVYLTKYASHVHLLVRSDKLRASKALQDRVLAHPAVSVHFSVSVVEFKGDSGVRVPSRQRRRVRSNISSMSSSESESEDAAADDEQQQFSNAAKSNASPLAAVRLVNSKTGTFEEIACSGVFYAIGHTPNTSLFRDSPLELDDAGYVKVKQGTVETSVRGVFAAGDVQDRDWRQAVTAAGTGCMAALSAERFLSENGYGVEYHQQNVLGEGDEKARESSGSGDGGGVEDEAPRVSDTKENFDAEKTSHRGSFALRKLYHESHRPIVVKYISKSCGPCRQLGPILSAVVREYDGKIHYVEIDIEEDADIAESAGVSGTPTVQVFLNKGMIESKSGVLMKSKLRTMMNTAVSRANKEALETADV